MTFDTSKAQALGVDFKSFPTMVKVRGLYAAAQYCSSGIYVLAPGGWEDLLTACFPVPELCWEEPSCTFFLW